MPPKYTQDPPETLELIQRHAITPTSTRSLEVRVVEECIPAEASFVLIGEASHGTKEFYESRAAITQHLIEKRGFDAVVVEADFPDAFRVNLYVRGLSNEDCSAEEALRDFVRFPQWMWRNKEVKEFIEGLKAWNDTVTDEKNKCGFYGMDLYSLHASAAKVIDYLEKVDPEAAKKAKHRYHCFDRFSADPSSYGLAVGMGGAPSCQEAALSTVVDMFRNAPRYSQEFDGLKGNEMAFQAKLNAVVVSGAEGYYRNMFFSEESTWNLRDSHFFDTVTLIIQHLKQRLGREPKLCIWAHNSHQGRADKTDMGLRRGEINIGQLMTEYHGLNKVYNIGFTTHMGTVCAAHNWDEPGKKMQIKSSKIGTYEHLLHRSGMERFALNLRHGDEVMRKALAGPLLERAIGVIYRPKTERQSHLFSAYLTEQFDTIIHFDKTSAVHPLDVHPEWHAEVVDLPETFPFGE